MNSTGVPPFVVFAAPVFSDNALRFINALIGLGGIRLAVVGLEPVESLPQSVREHIVGHWRVDDVLDPGQLERAIRGLAEGNGLPHRLLGVYEQLQEPLALVRERLGVPGMNHAAALNFRDKSRMKTLLRAAGLPCARHRLVTDVEEGLRFSSEVGHSVVFKPPAGAGAKATYRVDGADAVAQAMHQASPSPDRPVLLEEHIIGEEHSLETISIGGRAVWHSLTHYLPTPLVVLDNPWIQWCVVLPREVDDGRYDDIRTVAAQALVALGMDTGLSHMEWFRRPDGSVAISEVAARPPGAQIMTIMSRAHDREFHRAWAMLTVHGTFEPPPRRFAAGAAFLRGQGRGVVKAVHGLDAVSSGVRDLVVDIQLPRPGQPAAETYEGEGYVILRHPETKVVVEALQHLISVVRVEIG